MIKERRSFIGGSDARIVMGNDEAKLIRFWQEKSGSGLYFDRLVRFASRTPAPPPFSGINWIPPFSSAATSFSAVSGRPPIGPSELSKRAIVGSETPDSLAKSFCDQAKRARAAFSCRIEIILPRLIEFLLIVGRDRGNRNSISEAF